MTSACSLKVEETLLSQVRMARSCRVIDDVSWDESSGQFTGSLLWHGMPTTVETLRAFSAFAASLAGARGLPDVVVGVHSSGIAWATSVAMWIDRPLVTLRLASHKYGPWNTEARRYAGKQAWIVDNYVGSGETVAKAVDLLNQWGLVPARTVVVEARGHHDGIDAALEVNRKLRHLVNVGYFDPTGADVASRYARHGETWLAEAEWVRRIRSEINESGCLAE